MIAHVQGRQCTQCGEFKSPENFTWRADSNHKRLTSRCRSCISNNYKENPHRTRERAAEYYQKNRNTVLSAYRKIRVQNPKRQMLKSAKRRAKEFGLPFTIGPEDLTVPDKCPILGIKLTVNSGVCGPDSPSLDRIIPVLGYVPGNVIIISHKANTIKNNASVEELHAVVTWFEMQKQQKAAS